MSEFLTIGEPIALFASQDPDMNLADAENFHKFLAGAEVNVAVGVSRLGHSTEYITRLGEDPFGKFISNQLADNKIGTDYIASTPDYWTAFQLKQRVTHGDPGIFYFRKGSAAAHFDQNTLDNIDFNGVKYVHLSGIFPAISDQAADAFQHLIDLIHQYPNIRTTFDPNLRPQLWESEEKMVTAINALAAQANIILPGINEAEILMGSRDPEEIANFYLKNGKVTDTVIVKVGEKGAYVKTADGHSEMVPGYHVDKVVDTVGAGDGFAVGVLTGLMEGLSITEAAKRGNAVGALGVQAPGDNDGYPTPQQLKNFQTNN
ncbi:sugar kinase [Levilactobacillus bambusae]|uniref:2-dehydro-3-deoxygluconokinase n=1 Tax=Levilactobacillus bambusae TaxID=2024736 RepID=A0A2V1MYX9_9LACO|nr:sugar kinase [Levilactobacillus bambusae]PWG00179.1 2-dehydro-3-deoxygluconokinase [Levilactobacillus bambusae]